MALYVAVKRLGLEADHSSLSSASIKNELSTSKRLKMNRCLEACWASLKDQQTDVLAVFDG
jgi:hypothetical protein